MKLILYTGPQCELCEQAANLIDKLDITIELEKVNIRNSPQLYHRYGARIPVICKVAPETCDSAHVDTKELGWPFSLEQLRAFIT
jgi:hypothetical protein